MGEIFASPSEWRDFDRHHLWHPYAPLPDPDPRWRVVGANGVLLRLEDNTELIDGMSSWWCAIHGYNHPQLNQAVKEQTELFAHVMFGGLTHQPAIELGKLLLQMVPDGLDGIFFSDTGSVSVEVAIKIALQYWNARGQFAKKRLLTVRGGYHGDTFAAMSVCDPVTGMHRQFKGFLPQHLFAPPPAPRFEDPFAEHHLDALRELLQAHASEIAALIIEPVVQGAGGMRFYSPEYLKRARALCDEYETLFIADEIATGFGRAGKLFACEYADISPDIMCVGKALTGGYMSLAATLCKRHVSDAIAHSSHPQLMHGPTFMGNPLACAVAIANLKLLQTGQWRENVTRIEKELRRGLNDLPGQKGVSDVRVLGAIGVVEMSQPINIAQTQSMLIDLGVWLRPFGRLLYTMPPYIITDEQLSRLTSAMREVAARSK